MPSNFKVSILSFFPRPAGIKKLFRVFLIGLFSVAGGSSLAVDLAARCVRVVRRGVGNKKNISLRLLCAAEPASYL